jgi:hypothetical protein
MSSEFRRSAAGTGSQLHEQRAVEEVDDALLVLDESLLEV